MTRRIRAGKRHRRGSRRRASCRNARIGCPARPARPRHRARGKAYSVPGPKRAKAVRSIAHVPAGVFCAHDRATAEVEIHTTVPAVARSPSDALDRSGSASTAANAGSRTNRLRGAHRTAPRYCSSVPTKNIGDARDVEDLPSSLGYTHVRRRTSRLSAPAGTAPGAGARGERHTHDAVVGACPPTTSHRDSRTAIRTCSLTPGTVPSSIHLPPLLPERRKAVEHPDPEPGRVQLRRSHEPTRGTCRRRRARMAREVVPVDLVQTVRARDRQHRRPGRARVAASA